MMAFKAFAFNCVCRRNEYTHSEHLLARSTFPGSFTNSVTEVLAIDYFEIVTCVLVSVIHLFLPPNIWHSAWYIVGAK